MTYRADIQGLRAIAVLLVFIFHLVPSAMPGGFIGVDIFFVISGYLISNIILSKKEKKSFGFVDFYIGRFKRIVPVFIVFLLLVFIAGQFVYVVSDLSQIHKTTKSASIFNSNNYLASLDNYFGAASSENPLLHTWTLSIEMQFYFLLPLFLIFVKRKYVYPVSLVLIVLLISYSYYSSTFLNLKGQMYYSLPARIPEFLIGTIFAVKEKDIIKLVGKHQNTLSVAALFTLIASAIMLSEQSNFPGIVVLIPCLSAGLLLVCCQSVVSRFFAAKFFVHIGELSYSIYLWHWAVMAFLRYYLLEYDFDIPQTLVVIVATYVLSYLSYTFIEKPFRNKKNKTTILFLVVGYALLFGMMYFAAALRSKFSKTPVQYIQPFFGLSSHATHFTHVEQLGASNKVSDSILLLGDSHALAYKAFLDTAGKINNFNFRTITTNSIPTIPGVKKEDFIELKKNYEQYCKLIEIVEDELKSSKVILIASLWSEKVSSLPQALEQFIQSVDKHQKVIILSDYPIVDKNPIRVNRGIIKDKRFSYNFEMEIEETPAKIREIVSRYDNLYFLELDYAAYMKELPFLNDTVAYYDRGHLNLHGSQVLGAGMAQQFSEKLSKILEQ